MDDLTIGDKEKDDIIRNFVRGEKTDIHMDFFIQQIPYSISRPGNMQGLIFCKTILECERLCQQ